MNIKRRYTEVVVEPWSSQKANVTMHGYGMVHNFNNSYVLLKLIYIHNKLKR